MHSKKYNQILTVYTQVRSKEIVKKSKHNVEKENILRAYMTKFKNNNINRLSRIYLSCVI